MTRNFVVALVVGALGAVAPGGRAVAADKPAAIRIGLPGGSYSKPFANSNMGFVQAKALLEDEFGKDGIAIEYNFLKGSGPAVNEALANGSLDFGNIGDLPSIAGFAGGLKTRLLTAGHRGGNTNVVVHADSKIRTIADLKGKRVGVSKGTYMHAALSKILADAGLRERDVKLLSMDGTTLATAIATKDVDAGAIGNDAFNLRSRGVGRILHSTKQDPIFYRNAGSLLVREEFARKYPDIVRRFVKAYVKGAYLASKERAESQKIWTRNGTPLAVLQEDQEGLSLEFLTSPLVDEHFLSHYTRSIQHFKEIGLIRRTFDPVKDWIDRSYLDAALKELELEKHWPEFDANGKPKPSA